MLRPGLLYFAYGCNMDPETLSAVVGLELEKGWPAVARGWRLALNLVQRDGSVVATLLEQDGCLTHGIVYRLPHDVLPALDEFEEAPERYRRATLWVQPSGLPARQAVLTYIGRPEWIAEAGVPDPEYVALLVRGARLHGLPRAYVDWVEALARGEAGDCYRLEGLS